MIVTFAVIALVRAPLAASEGLDLMALGATQPALEKLDGKCRKSADLILGTPLAEVRKAAPKLSVTCAKPRFPKLAALIDGEAAQCALDDERCAAWLVHAKAVLLDVLGPPGAATDFAQVLTAIAALGVGDTVDTASANRAVEAADRVSAAKADNPAVQRLALAAWLSLPASPAGGADTAFAKLIPRVLATNGDDPEVWGAFVYMARQAGAVGATKQFLEAQAETAANAAHRARANYLRGCLAAQENDGAAARTAFELAAKADPFDVTYRKAMNDVSAGTKVQCKLVMTPFGGALRDAVKPR